MTTTQEHNTKKFEAEVSQVLDLVINSLYSNKEIFLRELISNSSDALDKLRFQALTNKDLIKDEEELAIKIWANKESNTLYIQDNGIGMNEADMANNLGTIARSGTREFISAIKESKNQEFDSNLIGKFGVGFYSGFIAASSIDVISKKAGENQVIKWSSEGKGEYTINELNQNDIDNLGFDLTNQGTTIILSIKDDEECQEFLESWKIRSIVKKYSDFIEYPITLKVTEKNGNGEDETLWENLNSQKAIWTRSKSEIKEEEYNDFYKHLSHDFSDPLDHLHYKAEGTNEYTALLYFPNKAPFDFFMPESPKGLNLYINKVFITNEQELLLPLYLRFIKGVVDASDLPLNVSREVLQQNPRVAAIKKNITKKILSKLDDMKKKDLEKYTKFYNQFGKVLKEGVHTDYANKNDILDLLLFESTKTKASEYTTLKDYITRQASDSKNIYYITGESRIELENSPYLEAFKAKDIEVLFLTDPIDEWVAMSGSGFEDKEFKSLTKGDLDLEEGKTEENPEDKKEVIAKLEESLKDKVSSVRYSNRLVDTLCCLVSSEQDLGANLERLYKNANKELPQGKRILEINKRHAVVQKLESAISSNDQDLINDYAALIYGQAQLLEGSKVSELDKFVKLVAKLMS